MKKTFSVSVLVIVVACCAWLRAERPTEPVSKADFVVVGKVTKVFHRDFSSQDEYVIQIRIEEIEKGEGYRLRDLIFAYAFQRKPGLPLEPSASGHIAIPEEGQRIRARIKRGNGEMEALYPEWFEVLGTIEGQRK
ncbi:MAG: hypothetical protein WBC44_16555 [Planctomycetaceae bacterium]